MTQPNSDRSELPAMPGGELRAALVELIATSTRDAYWCTRVWDAWRVGTMSEDDFASVEESEFPGELADSILALLVPAAAQVSAPADPCNFCGGDCQRHFCDTYGDKYGEPCAPVSAAVAAKKES